MSNPAKELCDLVVKGEITKVREILDKDPKLVNFQIEARITPIFLAIMTDNVEMVELLLSRGSDANHMNIDGQNPLHWVLTIWPEWKDPEKQRQQKENKLKIIQMLLDKGVDVNAQNVFGATPIEEALHSDFKEAFPLLESHGAVINPLSPWGMDDELFKVGISQEKGKAEISSASQDMSSPKKSGCGCLSSIILAGFILAILIISFI